MKNFDSSQDGEVDDSQERNQLCKSDDLDSITRDQIKVEEENKAIPWPSYAHSGTRAYTYSAHTIVMQSFKGLPALWRQLPHFQDALLLLPAQPIISSCHQSDVTNILFHV